MVYLSEWTTWIILFDTRMSCDNYHHSMSQHPLSNWIIGQWSVSGSSVDMVTYTPDTNITHTLTDLQLWYLQLLSTEIINKTYYQMPDVVVDTYKKWRSSDICKISILIWVVRSQKSEIGKKMSKFMSQLLNVLDRIAHAFRILMILFSWWSSKASELTFSSNKKLVLWEGANHRF